MKLEVNNMEKTIELDDKDKVCIKFGIREITFSVHGNGLYVEDEIVHITQLYRTTDYRCSKRVLQLMTTYVDARGKEVRNSVGWLLNGPHEINDYQCIGAVPSCEDCRLHGHCGELVFEV